MGARSDAVTEPGGADWLEEPIALGATMGRYELRRVVGTGGMGVVFEALDPELARPVAVKVLRAQSGGGDDDAAARLRRESRSMAQLTHPNVIRVYDVGVAHGHAFVAMELVVGTTLTGWLAAAAREPAEILGVFAQAGLGLAAAHAIGLVHRDFKPGNVMVADDGRVLVTDFGLARAAREQAEEEGAPEGMRVPIVASTITLPGQFVGTPAYMAPEQYAGGAIDARTDQFSFCVALWRALYGVAPFAGDAIDQLAAAAEAGWIEAPPAGVAERVAPTVRAALERGLRGDPTKRFPTMTELLAALQPVPSTRRRGLLESRTAKRHAISPPLAG
jgi:serine/threonine protein kinase